LWPSADGALPALLEALGPGDVVTVKGSNGMRMSRIVERLRSAAPAGQRS
jgi:UDP-N-acetylmuramyl pentapeptide synthase